MSAKRVYLAVDLGAESGRVVAGVFEHDTLTQETIHRFPNGVYEHEGTLRWNIGTLFDEIVKGIALAAERFGEELISIGIDSWGVDYALLDECGDLIELPFHYRDARTDGILGEVFQQISELDVFMATGIQPLFLNSLFQIYSQVRKDAQTLHRAHRLLFIPDLINYWLCGRQVNEYTIASTSQMMDMRTKDWAKELLKRLDIPCELLGDIVEPGEILGHLLPQICEKTGVGALTVVAVGAHDTASAVAGTPFSGEGRCFVSSGTWSLMGVEVIEPIIRKDAHKNGFSNEGGVAETIRFLKNINGLWILQECRRQWMKRGDSLSYSRLTEMAGSSHPFSALFDPDHAPFSKPGKMPEKIADFCRVTGQPEPGEIGAVIRVVLESLALKYRDVLERLEITTGSRFPTLNIVGGGSQNELFNQFTANAIGREVICGPIEAASAGNLIMQLIADGEIDSIGEGRELIRRSSKMRIFEPTDESIWDDAYGRYLAIRGK